MLAFFHKIIDALEACSIDYMLSGSLAMGLYVEPRSTRDFDFVIHLRPEDAMKLAARFTPGFYCDADSILDAVKRQSMFNIIDYASGYKADFIVLKRTPFRQAEFARRITVDFFGKSVFVVTGEDLFLSKLYWVQDYQSPIQMNDLSLLAELDNLDWPYIHGWIRALSLQTFDLSLP